MSKTPFIVSASLCLVLGLVGVEVWAQSSQSTAFNVDVIGPEGPQSYTVGIRIMLLLTALTLAPAFIMMMTSFTRVVIVLALVRQAMGTLHSPPNQVVVGLALFLTLFIMTPVWEQIQVRALDPYMQDQLSQEDALLQAMDPIRTFMLKQVREKDLELFVNLSGVSVPEGPEQIPLRVLIPAFVTSELRTAFQIGFLIYIPFLVIDMIVASILMSMGMMLLPPIMISLPFKLILFVLADGWFLIVGSLMESFN
ncbi:flagellar type III secretion system pore protein FliP [Candidatus Nitronereus thalassa]|uniref:Flagellar biosynthetic protein FliP n=1 Tax=Candidatus Nitronereus thalassa TaxID=3020898 RepID=A0ABU3K657_9BACT|nr:flagellar type III secretion system pore protein FliP [Candidatus Nitronereus thalassa]MDT7041907.1 flagellar type III secretion system pore protein FliP [Candidatus Nitronereus thalassa]